MQLPMLGSWSVLVHAVRPFTIHGDQYYEVDVSRLDDASAPAVSLRVPQHAVSGEPAPGQKLTVSFLMGQVTGAKPL